MVANPLKTFSPRNKKQKKRGSKKMKCEIVPDFAGKEALITGEAFFTQFISAKSKKPYLKWTLPTDLHNFEVMKDQLKHLVKELGEDTADWIGQRIRIEKETDAKGYKNYIFFPKESVEESVVK